MYETIFPVCEWSENERFDLYRWPEIEGVELSKSDREFEGPKIRGDEN